MLGERPEEPTLVALGLGPGCGEKREAGGGERRRALPAGKGRLSRPPSRAAPHSPWRRRWLGLGAVSHTLRYSRSGHVPARVRLRPRAAHPGPRGSPG